MRLYFAHCACSQWCWGKVLMTVTPSLGCTEGSPGGILIIYPFISCKQLGTFQYQYSLKENPYVPGLIGTESISMGLRISQMTHLLPSGQMRISNRFLNRRLRAERYLVIYLPIGQFLCVFHVNLILGSVRATLTFAPRAAAASKHWQTVCWRRRLLRHQQHAHMKLTLQGKTSSIQSWRVNHVNFIMSSSHSAPQQQSWLDFKQGPSAGSGPLSLFLCLSTAALFNNKKYK